MMYAARTFLLAALFASAVAIAADPPAASTPAKVTKNPAGSKQETSSEAKPASDQSAATTRRTNDRLNLDTTVVTGNRELPKVMYIVPWKKADIGDLPAQPFNTLIDEALTPVDRDVFRREVTYYDAVSAAADRANPASSTPPASPEK